MNGQVASPLHAFAGCGIELEYMIVDRESLSVLPVADRLLLDAAGGKGGDVQSERSGHFGWSNELALHLVEIKNLQPADSLENLPADFQAEAQEINRLLEPMGACLMPSAMHPWMDPATETQLWPHDNEAIYRAYDRIFDTRSHGWANLQSMHINLPFANDDEFERLHSAIRLVLPILPALAASSPVADGRDTDYADYRMHVYCDNARAFPSIAGRVVPETITSRSAYEARILAPMYRDIAPHDPDQVLQREWLNSRGAIARFDRNAIEIRVVDTQECPLADLAIAAATVETVRMLYETGREQLVAQQEMMTAALAAILQDCIRDAEQARITNARYLRLLGFPGERCHAGELWAHLVAGMMKRTPAHARHWLASLEIILDQGPLARRLLRALDRDFSHASLHSVYGALCGCLQQGRMFTGMQ